MRRLTARRIAIIGVGVAVVGGVIAVNAVTAATPSPPADSTGTSTGTSTDEVSPAQRTEDYWTPERMRDAQPAPMPEDG